MDLEQKAIDYAKKDESVAMAFFHANDFWFMLGAFALGNLLGTVLGF